MSWMVSRPAIRSSSPSKSSILVDSKVISGNCAASRTVLDAAQFPEITFESTKIEDLDGEELRIAGRLTIHGITNEVVLHADVGGTDLDLYGNERVGLEVTGVLARSDYAIKLTQALGSGNLVVGEKITLTLDLSAVKQA